MLLGEAPADDRDSVQNTKTLLFLEVQLTGKAIEEFNWPTVAGCLWSPS